MTYIDISVALIAVVTFVNLALILLVVKWARRHGEHLNWRKTAGQRLPVGTQIPQFTAKTITGLQHSLSDMRGKRCIVAFFSPGCAPCEEQLPHFTRWAPVAVRDKSQVIAVVSGQGPAAVEFVEKLDKAALVIQESNYGTLTKAFSIRGTPSFFVLDTEGRVEVSGPTVSSVATPVA